MLSLLLLLFLVNRNYCCIYLLEFFLSISLFVVVVVSNALYMHVIVHLGVSCSTHNCGCVVDGGNVMAAIC